ncbi:MAG: hypothetical protein D6701_10910 [Gemmatimonadetes bacterium]|nr:MAG: hypothetical protein D6701_10910 [Gemmatimonadota bacterium]
MTKRVGRIVGVFGVLALAAGPATAQLIPDPWTVTVSVEGGTYIPTRAYGQNAGDSPTLGFLQPQAKADAGGRIGGSIMVQLPSVLFSVGIAGSTTFGATVESSSEVCDVLDETNTPECARFDSDVTVSDVYGVFRIHRRVGLPGVRPFINLGLGLRRYSFDKASCSAITLVERSRYICERGNGLMHDQTQPLLLFGVGARFNTGPVSVFAQLNDVLSPYDSGEATGEAEGQNDLVITGGLTFRIF